MSLRWVRTTLMAASATAIAVLIIWAAATAQSPPDLSRAAAIWSRGEVPLWDVQTGRLLGQSPIFFPLIVLHVLWPHCGPILDAAARVLLAASGIWLLARQRGVPSPWRWIAAALMAGAVTTAGTLSPLAGGLAFAPWGLWALLRVYEKPVSGRIVILALSTATVLLSAINSAVWLYILILGLFLLAVTVRSSVLAQGSVVLGLLMGAAVGALHWWPAWQLPPVTLAPPAAPQVWIVPRAVRYDTPGDLLDAKTKYTNPREVALVNSWLSTEAADVVNLEPAYAKWWTIQGRPAKTPLDASIRPVNSRHFIISPPRGASGWAIVKLPYDPGWRCTMRGREIPVFQSEMSHLAIPLQGTRELSLRYHPWAWQHAAYIAAAGAAGCLLLIGLSLFRYGNHGRTGVAQRTDAAAVAGENQH